MKIKLNIPTSLLEITLGQYQEFIMLTDGKEDSPKLMQKTLEIFCGIDLKDIATIKFTDVQRILAKINKLFEYDQPLINRFKYKGKEFGFIPNLDEMSLGEFIDLDNTITKWDNMDKAMGVLYRPIEVAVKNKYTIEPYESYDKYDMSEMPVGIALGALVFFWSLSNELIMNIPNYLQREMSNLTYQQHEALLKSGVGINQFTDWQKEMSKTLTRLLR